MIGSKIYCFDKIDSTNEYIKKHLSELNNGDIVFAQEQTNGRGRHGNIWISPIGNLYFSFYLKEELLHNQLFYYLMKSSIAVINTLKKYNINAKIKYPNDIIIDRKKIAGILIESNGYQKIEYLIIGIGININETIFRDLKYNAISFKNLLEKEVDPKDVLNLFIQSYNELNEDSRIYELYIKNLNLYQKRVKYMDKIYEVHQILKNGKILLKNNKNTILVDYNKLSFSEIYDK